MARVDNAHRLGGRYSAREDRGRAARACAAWMQSVAARAARAHAARREVFRCLRCLDWPCRDAIMRMSHPGPL